MTKTLFCIAAIMICLLESPFFAFSQSGAADSALLRPFADALEVWEYKDYSRAASAVEGAMQLCARKDWWPSWFEYCQEGVNVAAYHSRNDERLRFIDTYDAMLARRRAELGPLFSAYQNKTRLNRATWHYRTGDVQNAARQFSGLAADIRDMPARTRKDTTTLQLAAGFLALICSDQGNYDEAITWQEYVLGLKQKITTEHYRPWVHLDYSNLATSYRHKKMPEKAEECYRKALADLNYSFSFNPKNAALFPNALSIYQNIAQFKLEQNEPDSAIFYLNYALDKGYANKDDLKARTCTILAEAWQRKGNDRKAQDYFEQSLAFNRSVLGDRHYETALSWKKKGDLEAGQHRYEKSLGYYQTALACLSPGLDTKNLSANPSLAGIYAKRPLLEILDAKSDAWRGMALQHPERIQYAEAALNTGGLAIALMDSIRLGFSSETDKIRLTELAYPLFERSIAAALQLVQTAPDKAAYYRNLAWTLAEKNKALTLQENLRLSAALEARLPTDIRLRRSKLRNEIAGFEKQVYSMETNSEAGKEAVLQDLKNQLFESRQDYNDLLEEVRAAQPEWFRSIYASNPGDWKQVAESLSRNAALLEYFAGDQTIYVFALTRKGLDIRQIQDCSEVARQVSLLRRMLTHKEERLRDDYADRFRHSAKTLYDLLLNPSLQTLPPGTNELVVVPDGILGNLPFELLLTGNEGPDFKDLPYLLRQYDIRYLASANMLLPVARPKAEPGRLGWAGFAPGYNASASPGSAPVVYASRMQPMCSGNEDLPGARAEVRAVARLTHGSVFSGDTATEAYFKEIAYRYAVLHLAMHGCLDTANALFSRLLFSPDGKGGNEDNCLYVNEIYAMRLHADLVVLSACNTGDGILLRGEGAQTLGRAFAYAGVTATAQSLWPADDESTRQIMASFYKYMQQGRPKSVALRLAKLDWLAQADGAGADPFFWADFVVYGEDAPVRFPSAPWLPLAGLLTIVLVLLAAIFREK